MGGRRVQPGRSRRPQHPDRCAQYALIIINMIFWLLSGVIIAFGSYVIVESKDHYKELADFKFQPSIVILIVGAIIFIITFIGCIGALRENTTLLRIYVGILSIILLAMVTCIVLAFVFRDRLREPIAKKLKSIIPVYRNQGTKYLDLQNIIDAVQTDWGCCGADSYNDWEANAYFNCTVRGSARRCGVPFSCCKKEVQLNRQCGFGVRDPELKGIKKTEALKNINTIGCVEQGTLWLTENWAIMGGVVGGVLLLQLASIFLANSLRDEVEELNNRRG